MRLALSTFAHSPVLRRHLKNVLIAAPRGHTALVAPALVFRREPVPRREYDVPSPRGVAQADPVPRTSQEPVPGGPHTYGVFLRSTARQPWRLRTLDFGRADSSYSLR